MLNNFYQCVLVVVLVAVCGDKCWYRGYNERLPRMRGKEKETIRDKLGPICRLYVYICILQTFHETGKIRNCFIHDLVVVHKLQNYSF